MTAEGPPAEVEEGAAFSDAGIVAEGGLPRRRERGPPAPAAPVLEFGESALATEPPQEPPSALPGRRGRHLCCTNLNLTVRPGKISQSPDPTAPVTHPAAPPQRTASPRPARLLRKKHRRHPAGTRRFHSRAAVPTAPGPAFRTDGAAGGRLRSCGGSPCGNRGREGARGAAAVGLADAAQTHPAELRLKQRLLALATVLARTPAVLALDEPTVGLDRNGLERLQHAVAAAAARGAGIVR